MKRAGRIKVALIGPGGWGKQHARIFAGRQDVDFCAVVGRTRERTSALAEEFGAGHYLDVQEMLDKEHPDLVSLCLPNLGHFGPTLQVIEAGYPLLVEKPLVFDLGEAETLLNEASRRGLFFAINFNHRYARPVQKAREAIEEGLLDEIIFATWRFGGEPSDTPHPHANLIETQCHGFDMLEYLCGRIDSIMAQMTDKTGRGYSTLSLAPALRRRGGRRSGRLLRFLIRLRRDALPGDQRHDRSRARRGQRTKVHVPGQRRRDGAGMAGWILQRP